VPQSARMNQLAQVGNLHSNIALLQSEHSRRYVSDLPGLFPRLMESYNPADEAIRASSRTKERGGWLTMPGTIIKENADFDPAMEPGV